MTQWHDCPLRKKLMTEAQEKILTEFVKQAFDKVISPIEDKHMLENTSHVRTSAFMDQVLHIGIERTEGGPDRVSVEGGRCSLDLSQQEARELANAILYAANAHTEVEASQKSDGGNTV